MAKKKINMKKWRDLTVFSVFSLFVIVTHQNCAPVGGGASAGSSTLASASSTGGENSTIDNVNKDTAVSFAAKELQLNSALSEIDLQGICAITQQDAVFGWEVRKSTDDAEAPPFATGYSKCDQGKFVVTLAPTQLLECGVPYNVKAQLGFGQAGTSVITRACPSGT